MEALLLLILAGCTIWGVAILAVFTGDDDHKEEGSFDILQVPETDPQTWYEHEHCPRYFDEHGYLRETRQAKTKNSDANGK